jgi:hypothetical protein
MFLVVNNEVKTVTNRKQLKNLLKSFPQEKENVYRQLIQSPYLHHFLNWGTGIVRLVKLFPEHRLEIYDRLFMHKGYLFPYYLQTIPDVEGFIKFFPEREADILAQTLGHTGRFHFFLAKDYWMNKVKTSVMTFHKETLQDFVFKNHVLNQEVIFTYWRSAFDIQVAFDYRSFQRQRQLIFQHTLGNPHLIHFYITSLGDLELMCGLFAENKAEIFAHTLGNPHLFHYYIVDTNTLKRVQTIFPEYTYLQGATVDEVKVKMRDYYQIDKVCRLIWHGIRRDDERKLINPHCLFSTLPLEVNVRIASQCASNEMAEVDAQRTALRCFSSMK